MNTRWAKAERAGRKQERARADAATTERDRLEQTLCVAYAEIDRLSAAIETVLGSYALGTENYNHIHRVLRNAVRP